MFHIGSGISLNHKSLNSKFKGILEIMSLIPWASENGAENLLEVDSIEYRTRLSSKVLLSGSTWHMRRSNERQGKRLD